MTYNSLGVQTNLGLWAARNDKRIQMMFSRVGRFFIGRGKKENKKKERLPNGRFWIGGKLVVLDSSLHEMINDLR